MPVRDFKKIRDALVVSYDIKQWFKRLKKDLRKNNLNDAEMVVVFLKIAKGLYNESIKLSCPKDIMFNEISVLTDLVENG